MSKHTPGKWIDDGDDIGVEIIVGGEPVFTTICTITTPGLYNTSDAIAEGAANKALILAAPTLLEALTETTEQLRLYLNGIEDGKDDEAGSAYQFGCAAIEAAREYRYVK